MHSKILAICPGKKFKKSGSSMNQGVLTSDKWYYCWCSQKFKKQMVHTAALTNLKYL